MFNHSQHAAASSLLLALTASSPSAVTLHRTQLRARESGTRARGQGGARCNISLSLPLSLSLTGDKSQCMAVYLLFSLAALGTSPSSTWWLEAWVGFPPPVVIFITTYLDGPSSTGLLASLLLSLFIKHVGCKRYLLDGVLGYHLIMFNTP